MLAKIANLMDKFGKVGGLLADNGYFSGAKANAHSLDFRGKRPDTFSVRKLVKSVLQVL